MDGLFNFYISDNPYDSNDLIKLDNSIQNNNLLHQDSSVKPKDEKLLHMMREKSRRDREKKMVHKMKNTIDRIKPNYFKHNLTKADVITNACDLIIYMHTEKRQLEEEITILENRQKILEKQNKNCFTIASHYQNK